MECKDWNTEVGKDVLDTLVGVRIQLSADAAVVATTVGYTDGAIKVAVDEDIALLRLRPYDPEHPENYVKRIVIAIHPVGSTYEDFDLELMPDPSLQSGDTVQVSIAGTDHLMHLDGTPAETLAQILEAPESTMEPGDYARRADFPDGRLLPNAIGDPVAIKALTWTEKVYRSEAPPVVVEKQGNPKLVLEQLNDKGETEHGRIVVDEELFAWVIDANGNITERGNLSSSQ